MSTAKKRGGGGAGRGRAPAKGKTSQSSSSGSGAGSGATSARNFDAKLQEINEILNVAQVSRGGQAKLLDRLDRLESSYAEDDVDGKIAFAGMLGKAVHRILLIDKKEPAVTNAMKFLARFACTHDHIFTFFLNLLCNLSSDLKHCVRWRVCLFISTLLETVEKQKGSIALEAAVFETVAERLRDKVPSVREAAAEAAQRLQLRSDRTESSSNSSNSSQAPSSVITQELARLLQSDTKTAVRKAALRSILPSRHTLPDIISRTRDTNADIRLTAFHVLQEKIPSRYLTAEQKKALAFEGLRDREPRVQEACLQMIIKNWLHYCNQDLLRFIQLFDVIAHESTIEMVLALLFKRDYLPTSVDFWQTPVSNILEQVKRQQHEQSLSRSTLHLTAVDEDSILLDGTSLDLPAAEQITPAVALLWRTWIEHAMVNKDELLVEKLVPSAPDLRILFSITTHHFVIKQLLHITHFVSLVTDDCGRHELSSIVEKYLEALTDSCSNELIPLAMKRLHELHPRISEFIDVSRGLIADLVETLDEMSPPDAYAAQLQELQDQLQQAPPDSSEFADLQQELAQLQETHQDEEELAVFILARSFGLIEATLTYCQHHALTPSANFLPFFDRIPTAVSTSSSPAVVQSGLRCLATLGLLDADRALQYFPIIFLQAFRPVEPPASSPADGSQLADDSLVDLEYQLYLVELETKTLALQCFFDLLTQYGTSLLNTQPASEANSASESTPSLHSRSPPEQIWKEVGKLMRAKSCESLQTVTCEGVAKVLLLKRVEDRSLLVNLILLFFHPSTAKAYRLRQCLNIFFAAYLDRFPENRKPLANAYLATVATILQTPQLQELPLWDITRWLIPLLQDPDDLWAATIPHLSETDRTAHDIVAEGLLSLIAKGRSDEATESILCRALQFIRQVNAKNVTLVEKLQLRAEEARSKRPDKQIHAKRALEIFLHVLRGATPTETEPPLEHSALVADHNPLLIVESDSENEE